MKNILIVGGTGFLGKYLRLHLIENHHVDYTYASQFIENGIKYQAGLDNLGRIVNKQYDILINNINPLNLTYIQCIQFTEDLISYCNEHRIKLIHISSVSALFENRFSNAYNLKKGVTEDLIRVEMLENNFSIIRFTQLFDADGLSRKSQVGLYYLLKEIKQNNSITIFSNHKECFRNYLPIELAIKMIELTFDKEFSGIYNAHFDIFTLSFSELLKLLIGLNKNYDFKTMVNEGDQKGLSYIIPNQSDQLISKIKTKNNLIDYFKSAYKLV